MKLIPKIVFSGKHNPQEEITDKIKEQFLFDVHKHHLPLGIITMKYSKYLDLLVHTTAFSFLNWSHYEGLLNFNMSDKLLKCLIKTLDYRETVKNNFVELNDCMEEICFGEGFYKNLNEIKEKIEKYAKHYAIAGETLFNLAKNKKGDIIIFDFDKNKKRKLINNTLEEISKEDRIYAVRFMPKKLNDIFINTYENLVCYNDKVLALPSFCQYKKPYIFTREPSFKILSNHARLFKSTFTKKFNKCYCCKEPAVFEYYFCEKCRLKEYKEGKKTVDLSGKVALVTGGRMKIGYMTSLKLLRMGCKVYITTRFPSLAYRNYFMEKDYNEWQKRLNIIGCDFRFMNQVMKMVTFLSSQTRFDFIINNACQTVKPSDEYLKLVSKEEATANKMISDSLGMRMIEDVIKPAEDIKEESALVLRREFSTLTKLNPFYDYTDIKHFGTDNTWFKKLEDLSVEEILEVNLINHLAPTLIIQGLTSVINKYGVIVNVTSQEGSFTRKHPTKSSHPHNAMTKASLDMLTRMLHRDYASTRKILVQSIDPGYVSSVPYKNKCILTISEAANRLLAPIKQITKNHTCLKALSEHWRWKNFEPQVIT